MSDWKVLEVQGSVSSELFSGSEEDAKAHFKVLIRAGARSKLVLRNHLGEKADEFVPEEPEGKGMTGKPIKEVTASLPPELLAASAKVREQTEAKRMQALLEEPTPTATVPSMRPTIGKKYRGGRR